LDAISSRFALAARIVASLRCAAQRSDARAQAQLWHGRTDPSRRDERC